MPQIFWEQLLSPPDSAMRLPQKRFISGKKPEKEP